MHETSLDMILSNNKKTKALIRLCELEKCTCFILCAFFAVVYLKIVSKYDQEKPQSQISDNPIAP